VRVSATNTLASLPAQSFALYEDPLEFDLAVLDALGAAVLAVADLDGDGNADLILASSGAVSFARGAGDGTVNLDGGTRPCAGDRVAVAAADFDGDGLPDIAVASVDNGGGVLTVFDSTDLFRSQTIGLGGLPTDMVAGDFNRDGVPDLAVAITGAPSDSIAVFP